MITTEPCLRASAIAAWNRSATAAGMDRHRERYPATGSPARCAARWQRPRCEGWCGCRGRTDDDAAARPSTRSWLAAARSWRCPCDYSARAWGTAASAASRRRASSSWGSCGCQAKRPPAGAIGMCSITVLPARWACSANSAAWRVSGRMANATGRAVAARGGRVRVLAEVVDDQGQTGPRGDAPVCIGFVCKAWLPGQRQEQRQAGRPARHAHWPRVRFNPLSRFSA